MNWWKELKGRVRLKEPLKNHTTFRIGGKARFFIAPKNTADLKRLLNLAKRYKISTLIIGAGSNILASDKNFDCVVAQLSAPDFKKLCFKNNYLEAGAGILLNQLIAAAQKRGLAGLEFLAGIPGTLGGALAMNAGAWGRSIGDLAEHVRVMDRQGNSKTFTKKSLKFGYRKSSLAKYIILNASLKLAKKDKEEIKTGIKQYLISRKAAQDFSGYSAGCVFKNPRGDSAGRLIDLCGLKGKRIGKAYISPRHANFILHKGKARAEDVLRLMELARKQVKEKFNITLEPEIKIWQ